MSSGVMLLLYFSIITDSKAGDNCCDSGLIFICFIYFAVLLYLYYFLHFIRFLLLNTLSVEC